MNVTAFCHVAFEDLGLLEPLLENLVVITGFSIAPEHTQFKLPDTMPNLIVLSCYRCYLPCYTQQIP
jgi:hypothetical protein